eukprot:5386406-Amphidinium_carterae.1
MAVEEARKRIRAQLDAGEDPLTATADREGHDVIERLHLRPAAKASRATPEERFPATESTPRVQGDQPSWGRRQSKPGCTGINFTQNRARPGDRPGKKLIGRKVLVFFVILCLWRTLALDRTINGQPRSCQDTRIHLPQPLHLQREAPSLAWTSRTSPLEAAWPQCQRRHRRGRQTGTQKKRKRVSGTGGQSFRPLGYRLPSPRRMQQEFCWQDEQQNSWRQEDRLSRS